MVHIHVHVGLPEQAHAHWNGFPSISSLGSGHLSLMSLPLHVVQTSVPGQALK